MALHVALFLVLCLVHCHTKTVLQDKLAERRASPRISTMAGLALPASSGSRDPHKIVGSPCLVQIVAKWESWNKLGNMTRDEAMQAYVDELHKIVETMSYNSDVASFLSVDDDEQGFPSTDLELVAGDVLARVRSEHNTPICSRSVSGASSPTRGATPPRPRHDSEDEYIDTVDSEPEAPAQQRTAARLSNGHAHQITSQLTHLKVLEQLPGTLARLEADVAALRKAVEGDRRILDQVSHGWRWPWQELSAPTLVLMFVWPFIAYRIAARGQRRRT